MNPTEAELLAVLRALDDPEHLEQPADYDRKALGARLDRLVARFDADFATACTSTPNAPSASGS